MFILRFVLVLFLPMSPLHSVGDATLPVEERLLQAAAHVRLGYGESAQTLLEAIPADAESSQHLAARKLLLGRALLLQGDHAGANAHLSALLSSPRPAIALLARYYHARSLFQAEDYPGALTRLEESWQSATDGSLGPELCRLGFATALKGGETEVVKRWHRRLKRCRGIDASEVSAGEIELAAASGEKTEASCKAFATRYPCAELPGPCHALELPKGLSARQRFERAENLFACWGYQDAAAEFEVCLTDPAFRRHRDRCHFYLGEIHARKLRDDRQKAFDHFHHVYQHGGGAKDYALYQMARCQMNLERYPEALALFERYIRTFPKGPHVERCYYYLGWLPYDHDDLDAALVGFDRYLDQYKKGELRSYILWFKAWSLFRLKRLSESARLLERLEGYGNDIVAGKAYYWLGRIALEQGHVKPARKWFNKALERYPLSYYGTLSWRQLEKLGSPRPHPLFEVGYQAVTRPLPGHLNDLVDATLARKLEATMDAVLVGEMRAARTWFAPHASAFEDQTAHNPIAAQQWLLSLLEEPSTMRSFGRKKVRLRGHVPTEKNHSGWVFEYPEAYLRLIEVQAAKTGLPTWFFYSIMRQESRYRRGVISWADAVGLVQVIPPTGSKTAKRLGRPFDRFNLSDPAVNLLLGTSYLGFLARDFHNQLTLVAASYNAGPDPIRTFVAANGKEGWDFLVEEIAYNEARNYCRKVTGHVLKYLATYAPVARRREVFSLLFPDQPVLDIGTDVDY
jgi:soluble lytic murein transglycosylase